MRAALVGDCASDPPLGATARALAIARADDLLFGLGLLAVAERAAVRAVLVRHIDAAEAMAAAAARAGSTVEVRRVPDAWPADRGDGGALVDAALLVQLADEARGRAPRWYLTIAGAVAQPAVRAVAAAATVEELVRAARPSAPDWVAVAGGAPAGRIVERDAPVTEVGTLLLVLPAGHEVVRRLKTPLGDWLARARAACEGCRVCSAVCARLSPHEVLWTLTSLRDDGIGLAQAMRCVGCGLCDVVCPTGISPRALVADVRDRFARANEIVNGNGNENANANANGNENANGIDVGLLTLRLGLAEFDQTPAVQL